MKNILLYTLLLISFISTFSSAQTYRRLLITGDELTARPPEMWYALDLDGSTEYAYVNNPVGLDLNSANYIDNSYNQDMTAIYENDFSVGLDGIYASNGTISVSEEEAKLVSSAATYVGFRKTIESGNYHIVFQAKSDSAIGSVHTVFDYGTTGAVISNPTLTTTWQTYEFINTATGADMKIYFASSVVGDTIYIDNLVLTPTNYTSNGDTEISFASDKMEVVASKPYDYESDFSAGVDGWIAIYSSLTGNVDSHDSTDLIALPSDASGIYAYRNNYDIPTGGSYRITADYYIASSTATELQFRLSTSLANIVSVTNNVWSKYDEWITISNGDDDVRISLVGETLGDTLYLKNVKFQPFPQDTDYVALSQDNFSTTLEHGKNYTVQFDAKSDGILGGNLVEADPNNPYPDLSKYVDLDGLTEYAYINNPTGLDLNSANYLSGSDADFTNMISNNTFDNSTYWIGSLVVSDGTFTVPNGTSKYVIYTDSFSELNAQYMLYYQIVDTSGGWTPTSFQVYGNGSTYGFSLTHLSYSEGYHSVGLKGIANGGNLALRIDAPSGSIVIDNIYLYKIGGWSGIDYSVNTATFSDTASFSQANLSTSMEHGKNYTVQFDAYSENSSDLKVKMGNGHGVDLVDDDIGDFSSGVITGWAIYDNNIFEVVNGELKITYVDDSRGGYFYFRDYLGNAYDLTEDLTDGYNYLLKADAYVNNGSVSIKVYDGSDNNTLAVVDNITLETFYHTFTKNSGLPYITFAGMEAGEIIYLDNIKLYQLGTTHTTTGTSATYAYTFEYDSTGMTKLNENFNDADDWIVDEAEWTIENGVATYDGTATLKRIRNTNISIANGTLIKLGFDISNTDSGSAHLQFTKQSGIGMGYDFSTQYYAEGSHSQVFEVNDDITEIRLYAYNTVKGAFSIDNIYIEELPSLQLFPQANDTYTIDDVDVSEAYDLEVEVWAKSNAEANNTMMFQMGDKLSFYYIASSYFAFFDENLAMDVRTNYAKVNVGEWYKYKGKTFRMDDSASVWVDDVWASSDNDLVDTKWERYLNRWFSVGSRYNGGNKWDGEIGRFTYKLINGLGETVSTSVYDWDGTSDTFLDDKGTNGNDLTGVNITVDDIDSSDYDSAQENWEYLTKGDYTDSTWSAITSGNNLIYTTIYNGRECLASEYVDNSNGMAVYLTDSYDLTTDLTLNSWYKVSYLAAVNQGSCTYQLYDDVFEHQEVVTSTDWVEITDIFQFNSITPFIRIASMSAGEIAYIDSVVIEPITYSDLYVKMGNGHGVDLVTNGTFDTDSDWSKESGWTISGGELVGTSVSGGATASQLSILTTGDKYITFFDITELTTGGVTFALQDEVFSTVGSHYIIYDAKETKLRIRANSTPTTLKLDNVITYKLGTTHSTTGTSATYAYTFEYDSTGMTTIPFQDFTPLVYAVKNNSFYDSLGALYFDGSIDGATYRFAVGTIEKDKKYRVKFDVSNIGEITQPMAYFQLFNLTGHNGDGGYLSHSEGSYDYIATGINDYANIQILARSWSTFFIDNFSIEELPSLQLLPQANDTFYVDNVDISEAYDLEIEGWFKFDNANDGIIFDFTKLGGYSGLTLCKISSQLRLYHVGDMGNEFPTPSYLPSTSWEKFNIAATHKTTSLSVNDSIIHSGANEDYEDIGVSRVVGFSVGTRMEVAYKYMNGQIGTLSFTRTNGLGETVSTSIYDWDGDADTFLQDKGSNSNHLIGVNTTTDDIENYRGGYNND